MKILEAHFSDSSQKCFDPMEWECPAQNRELLPATVCRGPEGAAAASPGTLHHCQVPELHLSGNAGLLTLLLPEHAALGLWPSARASWRGGTDETRERPVLLPRATLPIVRSRNGRTVCSTLLSRHDLCTGDGPSNQQGNKHNSFHDWVSFVTSFIETASTRASKANSAACRNLPFRCTRHHCNVLKPPPADIAHADAFQHLPWCRRTGTDKCPF